MEIADLYHCRFVLTVNVCEFEIVLDNLLLPAVDVLITRFLKCYISRRGYREGKWGFLIALMAFLYVVISYAKAELEKNN